MDQAMCVHHACVRKAISAWRGYESATGGSRLCVYQCAGHTNLWWACLDDWSKPLVMPLVLPTTSTCFTVCYSFPATASLHKSWAGAGALDA